MSVSVDELSERARSVIEQVARTGLRQVITDGGQAVAAIVPLERAAGQFQQFLESLSRPGRFGELAGHDGSVVDELISERRAEQAREDRS